MVEKAQGTGDPAITTAAEGVRAAAAGRPYTWGGHTAAGFDCSGYVVAVLRQAHPERGFQFMTAAQLFADHRLEVVTTPQPGDLIGFRKGGAVTHDHIGIVYDAGHWVGSQSTTGVARVSLANAYWSRLPHFFLRMKP